MDITLIQGTISGLKAAADITKSLMQLKSISEVQTKVIDLQTTILSAQSSALAANADQAAMIEEIRTLKEEIARIKAWESQKQRYQLTPIGEGATFVFSLKESMCQSEPAHWICTKCYEDGVRMILQPRIKEGYTYLYCPKCKMELPTHHRRLGPPSYAPG